MRVVLDTNILVSSALGGALELILVVEADPTDNKFLEAALFGEADYIVSGDSHLLELKTFRGISILTAREFIKQLM